MNLLQIAEVGVLIKTDMFVGSRDDRQNLSVRKWLLNNGVGTIIASTGFGKTRTSIKCINLILKKYPNFKVLVVVPTTNLKEQWEEQLIKLNLLDNVTVMVINTVIMHNYETDMLILDEIHTTAADTFKQVFECVKYKFILGLTATFERLDGKHDLIVNYCPVIDEITLEEAQANNWLASFTEYQVLINVDDLDVYKQIQRNFVMHFEFFNFDFNLVTKLNSKNGTELKKQYVSKMCQDKSQWGEYFKAVNFHAIGCMRTMAEKKNFINNHIKKIQIAQLIIKHRPEAKIITFSNNIEMAQSIGGPVYSSKQTKKQSKEILEQFSLSPSGVLNSSKKLVAGADIPGVNCEIILGHNSSIIRAIQTRGRAIRHEGENKHAEIFNIVINDTQDSKWFADSHKNSSYVTIDEENLLKVLKHEPYETYKKPVSQFNFRF